MGVLIAFLGQKQGFQGRFDDAIEITRIYGCLFSNIQTKILSRKTYREVMIDRPIRNDPLIVMRFFLKNS